MQKLLLVISLLLGMVFLSGCSTGSIALAEINQTLNITELTQYTGDILNITATDNYLYQINITQLKFNETYMLEVIGTLQYINQTELANELLNYYNKTEVDTLINNVSVEIGGIDGSIQFNDNGSLNGSSDLIWDKNNNKLGIGTSSPNAKLEVQGDTSSTGNYTAKFQNAGGKRGLIISDTSNVGIGLETSGTFYDTYGLQLGAFNGVQKDLGILFGKIYQNNYYSVTGTYTNTDFNSIVLNDINAITGYSTKTEIRNTHTAGNVIGLSASLVSGAGTNFATTYKGISIASPTVGGTNHYGIYINPLTTATNNYALYTEGSTKSYLGGNLGIGTTTPQNKLDVNGGAVIGSSYAGVQTAPTDGLMVEGRITGEQIETDLGDSVYLGENAGVNDDGTSNSNVGIGAQTLYSNSNSAQNVAIGKNSLYSLTTGGSNMGIGAGTLQDGTTLYYNTAIGYQALNSITTNENTGIGYYAGGAISTGQRNVLIGSNTNSASSTSNDNTLIGTNVKRNSVGGDYNVGVGQGALRYSDGNNNVALGLEAGYNAGNGSVFIGYQAGYNEAGNNKLYIDNSNTASPLIGGDFSTDEIYLNGNVGIGTTTPDARLDTKGAGNTSATYAAKFQNSDSNDILSIRDDKIITLFGTTGTRGYDLDLRGVQNRKIGWSDQIAYIGFDGDNNMNFYNNGVKAFYITPSGAIQGIGAFSATSLNVASSNLLIDYSFPNSRLRSYYNTEYTTNWNNVAGYYDHIWKHSSTELMRLEGEGNLGIGTTTPQNKLDVNGGAVIGSSYAGVQTAPTDGLLVEGNVGIGTTTPGAKLDIIGTGSTNALQIEQSGSGTSLNIVNGGSGDFITVDTSKLVLTNAGNLGLGSSSPQRVLHINDTLRLEPRSAAPGSAGAGDIYYDSDSNELCFYNSSAWVGVTGGTCS